MPLDDGTQLTAIMRRFYPLLLEKAYTDATGVLGVEVAFDLEHEAVQKVLGLLAKRIKDVADTTRTQVQTLVGQAAERGWSPAELAAELRKVADLQSASRAAMVARTETATAYTQGSILAYQESGVVKGTEWLLGGNPCPDCEPLGGTFLDFDAAHPPLHPNCTCSVIPVLKET